jgi:hypothetical protein
MPRWEYCAVIITATFADGSDPGEPQELLRIKRPNLPSTAIAHPLGALGLLNQLGGEGWELVDVEAGTFYLKRETK